MHNEPSTDIPRTSSKPLQLALAAGSNKPERLPGLLSVLKMLPNEFFQEIKSIFARPPQIKLGEVFAATLQETADVPTCGVIAALWAERWRQRIYCVADAAAVEFCLEVGLGGEAPREAPDAAHTFTKTEIAVIDVLFTRFSRALTNAFSLLVDVTFAVAGVSASPEEELASRPTAPVIAARIEIEWRKTKGVLTLIIPQMALDSVRPVLSAGTGPETSSSETDSSQDEWTRTLRDEIARAFVSLHAVLEQRQIPLGEVEKFRVGSTLPLVTRSLSTIRLDVEERPGYWCELGRAGGELSLQIEREIDHDELVNVDI